MLLVFGVGVLTAGCGSGRTSTVADCLHNAIAQQILGGGGNCADSSAAKVFNQSAEKMSVSCAHENGNDYVCDVRLSGATGLLGDVPHGFYDVAYDGKSITYEPAQ